MKLLIIGNGSTGTGENSSLYINNHTGYFLSKINSVHFVTFSENTTVYDQNNNLQNFDLAAHGINFGRLPNKKSFLFLFSILKLLNGTDYIYVFYPGTLGKIVALLALLLNKNFGMYIRGQYYNRGFIDRLILKRAKFVLTVSPLFAQDIKKFCSNVEIIKPMIGVEINDLNFDRVYKLKKRIRFLFVGRVEERKGIHELIRIIQILKKKNFDIELHIVGGGDLFEPIRRQILRIGLDKEVILHGLISKKDDLKKMYDDSDIFVFTSHDEGFPRVLYEAMASALPIFTTFVGGIAGRMVNLDNCIEIPVKSAEKAAGIIADFLYDIERLKSIGLNGLKTIEEIINGSYVTHERLLLQKIDE